MEYMYAAMLLHSARKEINENSVGNILSAAGLEPDTVRIKALVAALAEVDIEEAIKSPVFSASATAAPEPIEEEEENQVEEEEAEEEEEEDLQGLGALFI